MKLAALALLSLLPLSAPAFGSAVWGVTGQNDFGTLDLTTGNFNTVSNFGFIAAGMGEVGSTVYTANEGGTSLYAVNTATGSLSEVGTSSISYYAFGSTKTGLYMVDMVGGLWRIDPTNGTSTLVGSTHLDLTGVTSATLSSSSNILYLALNSNVYTINTTTGQAAFAGTSGSTDFGAMVDVSGTVYATSIVDPNAIYNFNVSTGISTFATAINAGGYITGAAAIVPEPGTLALLGLAGSLLCGYGLRRRLAAKAA